MPLHRLECSTSSSPTFCVCTEHSTPKVYILRGHAKQSCVTDASDVITGRDHIAGHRGRLTTGGSRRPSGGDSRSPPTPPPHQPPPPSPHPPPSIATLRLRGRGGWLAVDRFSLAGVSNRPRGARKRAIAPIDHQKLRLARGRSPATSHRALRAGGQATCRSRQQSSTARDRRAT